MTIATRSAILPVMTVHEIRLVLLRELIAQYGGATAFAAATGVDASTLSRVAGRKPSENIGSRLAEKIERSLGFRSGHLSDFSTLLDGNRQLDPQLIRQLHPSQKRLVVELLSTRLSARDARLVLALITRL
ncbi:hypothetical protein [Amantichitinum ursilacus]|uniref:hypothetical protein n=1 Tax=Amantichitinum ursilacus TaxID=857265 RepID=UPI00128ECC03|nr:hypothetical protein [Amantichitinum ursilacus]